MDSFFGVGLYRIDSADSASPIVNGPFETRVAGTGTGAGNGHAFLGTGITKIVVDPVRRLSAAERRQLKGEAERIGAFLGVEPVLQLN